MPFSRPRNRLFSHFLRWFWNAGQQYFRETIDIREERLLRSAQAVHLAAHLLHGRRYPLLRASQIVGRAVAGNLVFNRGPYKCAWTGVPSVLCLLPDSEFKPFCNANVKPSR